MRRYIGIPALALALALSTAAAFAPTTVQAADRNDILRGVAGALIVGTIIHKLDDNDNRGHHLNNRQFERTKFRHQNRGHRVAPSRHNSHSKIYRPHRDRH